MTTPVHIRNPRSPGGGWRPADMIQYPTWLLIIMFVTRWIGRHLLPVVLTLTFIALLIVGINSISSAILYGLILLALYFLCIYGNAFWRFKGQKTMRNLTNALVRKMKLHWYWEDVMAAAEIKREPFPRPKAIRYDKNGLSFKLKTRRVLKTSGDIAVNSSEIAASLDAYEVKVDTPRPAVSIVHVSWGDPTEREIRPGDVTQTGKVGTVAPANDTHGHPVELPIDLSLLVVGKTGSGKSTLLWDYLEALNKQKIPYKCRVIDPAGGVELADLKGAPNTIDYVESPDKIEDLLTKADKKMQETFRRMEQKGIRNAPVSTEFPLDILIVDEFLMLPTMDSNTPMGLRLATGRKGNHIVIGLSQLSQVDALGRVRDLFPLRMCLGTKDASVTNAVLGQDAEKMGAKCSNVDTPGVGYMYKDGVSKYIKFRAPNIYDEETEHIAQGGTIYDQTQAFTSNKFKALALRRTARYKFFNTEGRLLYTGIAANPEKRRDQHQRDKEWFGEIDHDLTEIDWYDKRKDAKKAETWSIHNENPLYNIAEAKKKEVAIR